MVEEAQSQANRRQSHGGSAMVGVWFLEKAQDWKDRKKGELRSEGQREKSTVIVGRGAEPLPVVAVMFEDGVTRVVDHEGFGDLRERAGGQRQRKRQRKKNLARRERRRE